MHDSVSDLDLFWNLYSLHAKLFLGHIQIAQVPNRDEPFNLGEINYEFVFGLLEEIGYTGYVGLEYSPKAGTFEGLEGTKFVKQ